MKLIIIIVTLLMCFGCAVQKDWVATGGSKADGTVKLSYQYGVFEKFVLDSNQAQKLAVSRCQAWGFTHSEAFGGSISQCQSFDMYGSCTSWLVTAEFQCID
jgi:hypothetical protein